MQQTPGLFSQISTYLHVYCNHALTNQLLDNKIVIPPDLTIDILSGPNKVHILCDYNSVIFIKQQRTVFFL